MTDSVYLILSSENPSSASFLDISMLTFWNDLEMLHFLCYSRFIKCIVGGLTDIHVVQHFMKMFL